ncbi:hypothetical protein HQN90_22710 [Paenibacillus alba]|uniref:hypothetical protein n=1 Tax=Paenibacillus alba TaxID=1197127 RepID=UPI001565A672|nr:hypothetical protein [Paenibacillus alba]NQX68944.1 hypothetical protein [Paenibacillus alba]
MGNIEIYDDSEIISLMKNLNQNNVLPENGLQRNSTYYTLVSYINHTIALYIGGSYDNVALFVYRADKEIEILITKYHFKDSYLQTCRDYLFKLSEYLLERNLLSNKASELIPNKYRS